MRKTFLLSLLLPLFLIACSGSKDAKEAGADDATAAKADDQETIAALAHERQLAIDQTFVDAKANPDIPLATHVATIKTSLGDIEVELYGLDAPMTVKNFVGLAQRDYYNGILFHRVVPGFVIQGGDPQTKDPALQASWGRGGTSIYGEKFKDELDKTTPSYKRGYVRGALAMANSGPNTNGSQFFIMLKNSGLPKNYSIFGKVTKGIEVVDKIVANGDGAPPKNPIAMIDVTATEIRAIPD